MEFVDTLKMDFEDLIDFDRFEFMDWISECVSKNDNQRIVDIDYQVVGFEHPDLIILSVYGELEEE